MSVRVESARNISNLSGSIGTRVKRHVCRSVAYWGENPRLKKPETYKTRDLNTAHVQVSLPSPRAWLSGNRGERARQTGRKKAPSKVVVPVWWRGCTGRSACIPSRRCQSNGPGGNEITWYFPRPPSHRLRSVSCSLAAPRTSICTRLKIAACTRDNARTRPS